MQLQTVLFQPSWVSSVQYSIHTCTFGTTGLYTQDYPECKNMYVWDPYPMITKFLGKQTSLG